MNGLSSSISATTLSTPIPTPPTVRFVSSALIAAAVVVLTTSLAREIQVIALLISTGAAFLVLFSHPYRKEIRTFLEKRNMHYTPKFAQVVPLFFVWLALMLAPLLAPAPFWITAITFLITFGWMWLIFPHVDGTRALAFVDTPPRT
ncbi:hypothetical protein [Corynebacterium rouxii]|uniref:Uncharacterized protein n=1 Tax=Corynebacterium rouxii TaxID=2719119 RepID=A0ABU3PLX9_9CORY|nr:hypothetical protein [Corynebacterium rouxii]MDT9408280.1 hypothetical protein [Corynebacterium rouxii]MDT9410459.1 hypothetical protein [Corynebacterium rouxii]